MLHRAGTERSGARNGSEVPFVTGLRMVQRFAEIFRPHVRRMVCLLLLTGALAACDRCGDWTLLGEAQSCRDEAPKQR